MFMTMLYNNPHLLYLLLYLLELIPYELPRNTYKQHSCHREAA